MNRPRLVERTCLACGRLFMARAYDAHRGLGRACSRPCSAKLREVPASLPGSGPSEGITAVSWPDFVATLAGSGLG